MVGDRFEYTLAELGATWRDEDMSFTLRYYIVRDRADKEFRLQMLIPADRVDKFAADQHAYFQALDKKRSPKYDAAVIPHTFTQAA